MSLFAYFISKFLFKIQLNSFHPLYGSQASVLAGYTFFMSLAQPMSAVVPKQNIRTSSTLRSTRTEFQTDEPQTIILSCKKKLKLTVSPSRTRDLKTLVARD
jgi:hypothetical protein